MTSLKLTPFEESLYVDDCAAYPWNILFRLRFHGLFDRSRFQAALTAVAARHPLLRAAVRRNWIGRFFWDWPDDGRQLFPIAVRWNEYTFGERPEIKRLALEQGGVLEIWVAEAGERSEALLHFHHAAIDGLGAEQVMGDLLLAYDAFSRGESPGWTPLNEARLHTRAAYGYNIVKFLRNLPKLLVGLRGVKQFVARKPVPIVTHEPAGRSEPLPTSYPTMLTHVFSVEETQSLRAAAHAHGATFNDLLARDLFIAIQQWRERRVATPDMEWLRLAVPVDMRTSEDDVMPAANVVSIVFLDRNPLQIRGDTEALLQSVHEEMSLIKRNELGLIYLLSLRVSAFIPGLMDYAARRQKFCSSVVLSNLRRPFDELPLPRVDDRLQAGDVRLDNFEFFVPIRPFTCATFGVSTYAGRLHVSLQADSRFLSASEINELKGCYVEQLARSLRSAQ